MVVDELPQRRTIILSVSEAVCKIDTDDYIVNLPESGSEVADTVCFVHNKAICIVLGKCRRGFGCSLRTHLTGHIAIPASRQLIGFDFLRAFLAKRAFSLGSKEMDV